jgi:bla regulator protein BlaR1
MFMEWISGDVSIRGMKPKHYVLKKQAAQPAPKMVKSDSSPVGQWKSVDFVKDPKNFRPAQQAWSGDLFLKEVAFKPDGGTSGPWTWQKNQLADTKSKYSAEFKIQASGGKTYMFFPWISGDVTIRGEKPRYYVLEKVADEPGPSAPTMTSSTGTRHAQAQKRSFVADPAAVGSWESVDFVKNAGEFTPGLRSWGGDLYLKGLEFKEDGSTSGPWSWTKGWLQHPGDKSEGRYQIKTIGGTDYLFMEWISGDVTIRGMKPQYYVMRRIAERAESK